MISTTSDHLLFIEPQKRPSPTPLVDVLTRKLTGAWRKRTPIEPGYRGTHSCTAERCYADSDHYDYLVAANDGRMLTTNALAIHYLAHHRDDVPPEELAKVAALVADEAEPTNDEMNFQPWPGA